MVDDLKNGVPANAENSEAVPENRESVPETRDSVLAENRVPAGDVRVPAKRSILISCPGDLLTAILVSAVLEPTRKAFPQARICLLVKTQNASIFSEHEQIDCLLTIDDDSKIDELAQQFKRLQIDTIVHIVVDERIVAAAEQIDVPVTYAFATKSVPAPAKILVSYPKYHNVSHPIFHAFELLAPLGVKEPKLLWETQPIRDPETPEFEPGVNDLRLDLTISAAARLDLFEKLKRYDMNLNSHFAVICLDSARGGHAIDTSIYAAAAKYLHKLQKDLPIFLVGFDTRDHEKSHQYSQFNSKAPGINVYDFSLLGDENQAITPAQVAELLKHADICISADNAVAYLANFVKTPLVVLTVDPPEPRAFPRAMQTETVYTSAQYFPWLEWRGLFHWRAARSFSLAKIRDAIDYVLTFSANKT